LPPKQAELPLQVPLVVPLGTVWQVPTDPETLHELQTPQAPAPQQTPSTQLPLPHTLASEQVWPLTSLQVPAKHAEPGPVQVPLVVPSGTVWQVPRDPETSHELQRLQLLEPQHTPSTQFPLPHWPPPVQV